MRPQAVRARLSRRAFVRLAGLGASMAGLALVSACDRLPFVAKPRVARIGYLWGGSTATATTGNVGLRDGLRDAGWVEGQNLVIEDNLFEDHPERIQDLAAELVASKPDVLIGGNTEIVTALKRATDSIPIVFLAISDPVGSGLIASYARPGGNVTGTSRTAGSTLGPKLLELLRQLVPGLARVAVVFEPASPAGVIEFRDIQAAAQRAGVEAQAVEISSPGDLARALDAAMAGHPQALIETGGSIIPANQPSIIGFAIQDGLPTAAASTFNSVGAGGLLFYGPNVPALYRRAGSYYVDRILRGAKPADLPVEGPISFELLVNQSTAQALGIAIPPELAAQVTEWIE
jgi:putative ABC transport system substrate-binding protein